ncbi:MAG: HK97 family phage prohead protease [Phycisphaerae bacterium]|nr:HK97 family phage prohead protease [Phycisphaerae bacterium]
MDLKNKEKHYLGFIAENTEKAAINEEARTIRFVISSNKLDRDNEIVQTEAIAAAIKDFAKNPVALNCHQHRLETGKSPVIGSWDTDSFKAYKNHCEMDLRFAKTESGEEYWQLYKDKHMRAVSIGFRVLEYREEKKDGKRYWIITKIELYEISCVPVGANREALSKVKGLSDFANTNDPNKDLQLSITKSIDERFCQMEDVLAKHLEEIKDLILTDDEDGDFSMLDAESDASVDEVNTKAEQLLEAFQNAITEFKNN